MTDREKAAFIAGGVVCDLLDHRSLNRVIRVMSEALHFSMADMPTVHDIVRESKELLELGRLSDGDPRN
jgi:hypothetical protein